MASTHTNEAVFQTRVLPVPTADLGCFKGREALETWELPSDVSALAHIQEAASYLQTQNIPVAFPTETVYGLGADATRSDAVLGIYKAKGRPSDNPLIIHICDLTMLRSLLVSPGAQVSDAESIPDIYKPLIKRFWPGPLTILLPNPIPSKLAPEVTAGLKTFGARMPSSPLALSLIRLSGVPIAAPSANASTKPSCTTADHVFHDLHGRIEIILDGGACTVGVESTVVDGLCSPPVVLRPGGVSIDDLRQCEGWEGVVKGYKDSSEVGASAPRAPGMKYKHYSPKAKVVLYEDSDETTDFFPEGHMVHGDGATLGQILSLGVVCTRHWDCAPDSQPESHNPIKAVFESKLIAGKTNGKGTKELKLRSKDGSWVLLTQISLGGETKDIAHGLFSALRELDERGVDVIYVEGIKDEGDIAAAVMNRLRKAATVIVEPR